MCVTKKNEKEKKKRIVATLIIVVRACVAFILSLSRLSVRAKGAFSLYFSLTLSPAA